MNAADGRTGSSSVTSSAGDDPALEHVLLTVLGKNPKSARYALGDREAEAKLAPVALFNLLWPTKRPDRVLALCCTREAKRDSWPLLYDALGDRCQVVLVEVSGGDTQEDVNAYLATVADHIPRDVDLTVDVTRGFRHFSKLDSKRHNRFKNKRREHARSVCRPASRLRKEDC